MVQRWATLILLVVLASGLIVPVNAHTTVGSLTGSAPLFRSNEHELNPTNTFGKAHVPGPLGYVWPGSGLNVYSGVGTHPPGYQSPFTTYEPPLQVDANSYAPEGGILTSTADHDSVGDLIFALNFSQPARVTATEFRYSSITIYIPAPMFDRTGTLIQDGFEPAGGIDWDGGENTNIVTTITDNYGNIFATRADKDDPFAPGSWMIFISSSSGINFTSARDFKEWYYIRINQMKAPFVAGRYFFKVFLDSHYQVAGSNYLNGQSHYVNSTMPMENWPVLLVKGEVDPGIISGTLRHGDLANSALYSQPICLPGKVRAVGYATDPISGELTGRAVEARGYFNGSAQGHFEIEGVPPGIYDIFGSAAGYPERKVAEKVKIFRGQSLKLDAYLIVGPEIRGEIFSKDEFGLVSWPGTRPVTIVIYDSDTYDSDSIVTYSPTNLTHAPYTSYVYGSVRYDSGSGYTVLRGEASTPALNDPRLDKPRRAAFPWEGRTTLPDAPWVSNTYSDTTLSDGVHKDCFGLFNGVGPAQYWWTDSPGRWTNGGGSKSFRFQFGIKGFYGAPTRLSGMIPQVFATWTDSLTPGRYYVRTYVNGYVQTTNDGTEFQDYAFIVPDSEFSRDISLPIDLWRSSTINVTVHFHDLPGTTDNSPIKGPDPRRFLIAEAFDGKGNLAAFNFTQVTATAKGWNITLNGFGMAGPMTIDPVEGGGSRVDVKYSVARYRNHELFDDQLYRVLYDYGLPTDTYTVRIFMRGYIQALPPATSLSELDQPLTFSVSVGTGVASVSTHMYRGGGINATIFSVDWERPPLNRKWLWSNSSVNALVYDIASQNFVDVIYFWDAELGEWTMPKQNSDFDLVPWPNWKEKFGTGASYLLTNGSTQVDRFGPDIQNSVSSNQSQDMATPVFFEENFHIGFLYSAFSYRDASYRSALAIYPSIYAVNVWTYGYVQENVARLGDLGNVQVAVAQLGSMADTSVKVMVGVNFTITILFKTEGIFSEVPYNSSVRIRVFDESDTLIAAATLSSNGGSLPSNTGLFADGEQILEEAIPAGTHVLECNMSGLLGYVELSEGGAGVQAATLFSPDHGVWGRSIYAGSYTGSWIVMVDFVNWYLSDKFYLPVPALLQGESPFFFSYNHLGPYRQMEYTKIPNIALGGEASIVFQVDLRSYLQGLVLVPDWNDVIRTTSWASIDFKTVSESYHWYTFDGWFDGYLDPGDYQVTVAEWTAQNEGHNSRQFAFTAGAGQINRANEIVLDLSGKPIPEFAAFPILAASVAAALIIVRSKPTLRCLD